MPGMTDSPNVQAVRAARVKLASDYDYDLGRLLGAIRKAEQESGRRFLDLRQLRTKRHAGKSR